MGLGLVLGLGIVLGTGLALGLRVGWVLCGPKLFEDSERKTKSCRESFILSVFHFSEEIWTEISSYMMK